MFFRQLENAIPLMGQYEEDLYGVNIHDPNWSYDLENQYVRIPPKPPEVPSRNESHNTDAPLGLRLYRDS